MKKYIHNIHKGTLEPVEEITMTYQMWPVMYELEVTRWRVVRLENNIVQYERVFESEKQARAYIKQNESV
jgi:hypothetical protein